MAASARRTSARLAALASRRPDHLDRVALDAVALEALLQHRDELGEGDAGAAFGALVLQASSPTSSSRAVWVTIGVSAPAGRPRAKLTAMATLATEQALEVNWGT